MVVAIDNFGPLCIDAPIITVKQAVINQYHVIFLNLLSYIPSIFAPGSDARRKWTKETNAVAPENGR